VPILRFIDPAGEVRWGRPVEKGAALPLCGDLFGEFSFADQPVRVVRRLPPVSPPNIWAIGRNYREHAREMKAEETASEPLLFLKATTSVIGPDDLIRLPLSAPDEVDYEGELAVVIGRRLRHVSVADALEGVLGYTCANDVSARDCQKRRDKQWARGKSFDSFCPLGPLLVLRDELPTLDVTLRTLLNGQVMQQARTREMIFPVPELVSYLSRQFTLLPGTVILTGTPAGVGSARQPPVYLRPGDEITVEIEGIGRLSNRVGAETPVA